MILFCELQLLRQIVATGHIPREQLIKEILEAFPDSNLKRVYNNGLEESMTIMLMSRGYTGKEAEMFCKIKGFWMKPNKLKMHLVRWLYKNGMSTLDANLLADLYIPEVKKAYSTTPVETTYYGIFAFHPKTIEREVINERLGLPEPREQHAHPLMEANQ